MAKKKPLSWAAHHATLNDEQKKTAKQKAMQGCEWSEPTFYVKMKNPQSLKFWEKQIVVKAYSRQLQDFFPEEIKKSIAA